MAANLIGAQPVSAQEQLSGIKVIDVDTHLSEPADLWTSRAPAKYKDRVPQIRKVGERLVWMLDDRFAIGSGAMSAVYGDGSKARNTKFKEWNLDEVHPACSQTMARVELMDQEGIWAQVVYPNVLGFGGQLRGEAMHAKIDEDLRLVSTQIYNDAMADMQAESGGRICGMALLPWWDIRASAAEAERCHAMGLRGVNINPDPHTHGQPDLSDDAWTPLWEVCSDKALPVNFHIGSSTTVMDWNGAAPWPSMADESKLAVGSTMIFVTNAKTMINLITSGMLERYPKLKFVSVESGIGWMPFILEALEYELHEAGANADKRLSLTPAEYFRRQIYGCFWFEKRNLAAQIRRVGVDNCMFETDFPHPTCLYPNPLASAAEALKGLTPEETRKVMSGNAAKLYKIPIN
jgi:predicted TIM-barrel fold metal-dependent hydrolase